MTYSLYPLQYSSSIICPGALNCRAAVLLLGVVILLHIIPPCSSLLSVARSWVCLGFAAHQSSCHLGFSCRFAACHPSLLPGYWFTTSHQVWVYHRDVSFGNFALAFGLRGSCSALAYDWTCDALSSCLHYRFTPCPLLARLGERIPTAVPVDSAGVSVPVAHYSNLLTTFGKTKLCLSSLVNA